MPTLADINEAFTRGESTEVIDALMQAGGGPQLELIRRRLMRTLLWSFPIHDDEELTGIRPGGHYP